MLNTKISVPRSFTTLFTSFLLIFAALPVWCADKAKDEETLRNAANVLESMIDKNGVPTDLLETANCIIILPGVKKFAFGVGGSGGRGPMSCRSGEHFNGRWSAPAMYSIGGASAGFQVGGSSTDFVLLVMADSAVKILLDSKVKVGSDVTAAAGPSGATAINSVGGANILTYARAKGLFAGVSLSGASLQPDTDANERLYGKPTSARSIVVEGAVKTPDAGRNLVTLLDSKLPKRKR